MREWSYPVKLLLVRENRGKKMHVAISLQVSGLGFDFAHRTGWPARMWTVVELERLRRLFGDATLPAQERPVTVMGRLPESSRLRGCDGISAEAAPRPRVQGVNPQLLAGLDLASPPWVDYRQCAALAPPVRGKGSSHKARTAREDHLLSA
jgi:hypothetical protein